MTKKQAVRSLVLITAGLILAVQAGLAAHSIAHVSQQADAYCAVCAFDGYAKAPPTVQEPVADAVAGCETPAKKSIEPARSVHVGRDRIRAPPTFG